MKTLLHLFVFVTLSFALKAQEPCGFDRYKRQYTNSVNNAEKLISGHLQRRPFALQLFQASSDSIKKIPVVVHIIHNGGKENISAIQIRSQIEVLNEDYRKKTGTNGDGAGVDTKIEFCLATRTPEGKCTDGIVRIQSALTNHQTYQRSQLKNLSFWDNTRYLNIYVVKDINNGGGTAGYSSFAGGPPDEDGVVIRHDYFGRGTGSVVSSSNGRTMTHEIGHWLGLYHTFNDGCGNDVCTEGDYVCDTPPAAKPNYGCPTTINSCSNDVPDVNDLVRNYMDYSGDACKNMFTAGQRERMHASLSTLRSTIWSTENITATGCDTTDTNEVCNVIADFTSNARAICIGNQVTFTNKTLNKPLSWKWFFPGGTPDTSTASNPNIQYNALGSYPVKLVAYGASGKDSLELSNYIVVGNPPVGQKLPFTEDFENDFPSNGITIENPDGGITWEKDTVAVPFKGKGSAKINNLINTNYGQTDALVLPSFDFTASTAPALSFSWAYAKSDPTFSDELLVLISTDCGVNWKQIFYRNQMQLATGKTQKTPYIPDSTTLWKTANIDLKGYMTFSNVQLKIVNVTDGGNNLYIDALTVGSTPTGISESITSQDKIQIYPNPSTGSFTLTYTLNGSDAIQLSIVDVLGREVYSKKTGELEVGTYSSTITLGTRGVYYILFRSGSHILKKEVIITQ